MNESKQWFEVPIIEFKHPDIQNWFDINYFVIMPDGTRFCSVINQHNQVFYKSDWVMPSFVLVKVGNNE